MSIVPISGSVVGVLYTLPYPKNVSVWCRSSFLFLLCVLIVHGFRNYYSIKCKILFPINVSLCATSGNVVVGTKFGSQEAKVFPDKFRVIFVMETMFPSLPKS